MILNLPKLGAVEFPDNLSPEQFDALVGKLEQKYDFRMPKPEVGLGEIAKRGFMRSLGETGIALGDTIPGMVGSALGFEDYAKQQMGEAAESRAALERKYPTRFKSYKDISSPFEALEYGAETLGELVPTAATAMIPGVGGEALAGRMAGKAALEAATAAGPASRAALAGVQEAGKAAARKGMYGGVFMGSFAQNAPEVFEGIYQETGKFEPGIAALAGGMSAVLDSVLPAKVLDTLGPFGKAKVIQQLAKESGAAPKVWKYMAKELPKAAAMEGLTEGAQEALGAYAEQVAGSVKGVLDPENIQRYKEAFVKGAIGGVGFGAPVAVSEYRTAKKDYNNTKEAEAALQAQYEQEKAAGALTPEKEAQYQEQLGAYRAKRQSDLEAAFQYMPEELAVLQARMDKLREDSPAYKELEAEVTKLKQERDELDAEKAALSAFSTAKPTPGTGGMFKPGLEKEREQRKIGQEQGLRGFAFGDMGAATTPVDPITVDTLKGLRISDRSKLGMGLLGIDMGTPEGVRSFIQTMEDPAKVGTANVNEQAYTQILDSLYADGRGAEVEAARAEMKPESIEAKKQQQQAATRSFAFGDQNVAQPVTPTGGEGAGVAGKPAARTTTKRAGTSESDGMVPSTEDAGQPAVGKEQPAPAITPYEEGVKNVQETGDVGASPYKEGTPEYEQYVKGQLDAKYPSTKSEEVIGETTPTVATADTAPAEAAPAGATPVSDSRKKRTRKASQIAFTEADQTPHTGKTLKDLITPDFGKDYETIINKLSDRAKVTGLTEKAKDARAYFGKVMPELALKSIANDLVYQPTAYRQSTMKAFEGREYPERTFGTEAEAEFFKGQGGVHALNAADWVRANLSPDAVAFMDKWIAQYEKENQRSQSFRTRMDREQKAKAQLEADLAAEKEAKAEKPKKAKKEAKKVNVQKTVDEMHLDDMVDDDFRGIVDGFDADPEAAALHGEAHPVVLHMLAKGDLVGALEALGDSASSEFASRIARLLSKIVGNVKLVYGAEKAHYDPKTNTIYLPDNASEYELLHEAAHAGLSHIIANPSHPVTRQLAQIFKDVKADIDGAYGAKDLQEFVAEFWSNDRFRSQLKEKYAQGNKLSVWDKIMNVIRRALGYPAKTKENTFDKIDRMLNEIVSVPPDERTGDSLYAQSIGHPNVAQRIMSGMDTMIQKQNVMTPERAAEWLGKLENTGLSLRQASQRFLNLSALGQVGEKLVGRSAIEFSDSVNQMAGYYENLMEKLQPLHKRLEVKAQDANYQAWSTLVHESTLEDVDPRAPRSKYTGSPEKLAAWDKLHRDFAKMGADDKKLYSDLFDSYKQIFNELKASIRQNLLDTIPDKEKALSAYEKVLDMITKKGIEHYAPLYRQGDFWLQYTDGNGQTVQRLFNSQAERRLAAKQALDAGFTGIEEYSRLDNMTSRNVPSGTVAAQIIDIMRKNGAEETAVDEFLKLLVSAMPETSLLKSFQSRKGTPGYLNDASLAFANVTSSTARQLSRMRYSDKLNSLLDDMREKGNALRGEDNVRAKELVQEFEARRKFAMNPTISDWARYASTGAFYFNLAGNVSSAVVNLLQTPMVVLPHLGGPYGFTNAAKAIMAATKLYASSGFSRQVTDINGQTTTEKAMLSIENLVNAGKAPQYAELVKRLKELGFLQTSTARDALEASNRPQSGPGGVRTLAEKTAMYSSFAFHHAERMNREVTAVAAYDLEMAKSGNKEKAIEKAIRAVEFTHGAGHAESAPSIGHSDIGKVLTVFKRFGFTMYYMLFDTIRRSLPVAGATGEQLEAIKAARRQLVGIYGMAGLFAGVKGMPLYWIAEMAYNALNDDDDDDFDAVMRKYLGELAFKGPVNYFTNLSIADRVGWTDLIYRENKGDKADASALSQITEAILGAPYAIVNNFFRGKELIADGHFERGVETMLPIALRNVLKGVRYATEGVNTLRGDPVMGEVNGYNAAMQVLGFAPADLMAQYEENAYAKKMGDTITNMEKRYLKQYYVAEREGDFERAEEIYNKLMELGDKYPELKITDKTVSASVKARDRISDEMYHGVQLNKKLRPRIEDAIRELHD